MSVTSYDSDTGERLSDKKDKVSNTSETDMSNYTENPIRFRVDIHESNKKYISIKYLFGKKHIVENPVAGEIYLKVTVAILYYDHDGYCSDFDTGQYPAKTSGDLTSIYMKIPAAFLDTTTGLIKGALLYEDESSLLRCDETEPLFREWKTHPSCMGSYYCGLKNLYEPLKIELVRFNS